MEDAMGKKQVVVEDTEAASTFTVDEYAHELVLRLEETKDKRDVKSKGLHRFYVASMVVLKKYREVEKERDIAWVSLGSAESRRDQYRKELEGYEERFARNDLSLAPTSEVFRELIFRGMASMLGTRIARAKS
jgi:hypothetical protein